MKGFAFYIGMLAVGGTCACVESHEVSRLASTGRDHALEEIQGTYIRGDRVGWEEHLTIDGDGVFQVRFSGCVASGSATGHAILADDVLIITECIGDYGGQSAELRRGSRFHVVRWSSRTYLVHSEELADYVGAIRTGIEPRGYAQGPFYLRESDWKEAVESVPCIPAPWRDISNVIRPAYSPR